MKLETVSCWCARTSTHNLANKNTNATWMELTETKTLEMMQKCVFNRQKFGGLHRHDKIYYALVFITRSGIGLIVLHCRQLGQHQCRDLTTKPQLSQR